jgi:Cupin-like domain
LYNCFASDINAEQLDLSAFKFHHKLMGHPALTLENLARVLPALPKNHVTYSNKLLETDADFESTFQERPRDVGLEQTIESIRTADSYIMVSSPEHDQSFQSLHKQLLNDVEGIMRKRGVGTKALGSKLFLFIASPNSITPFHIDRYSTFLMQFRGSKEIAVFPQWDPCVVTEERRECYVARTNTKLPYTAEIAKHGTSFKFAPGEALHIPFVAGHHVKNGKDDVSISMSIIFNTDESLAWRNALLFNHGSRKFLKRVGVAPAPVGRNLWRDKTKATLLPVATRALSLLRGSQRGG